MDFSVSDLPFSYSHLPSNTTDDDASASTMRRRSSKLLYIAVGSFMVLLLVAMAIVKSPINNSSVVPETISTVPVTGYPPRGVKEGVSEKSSGVLLASDGGSSVWTNEMLSWQRSEYHFQPEKNWMNDPNGVMYYNGWYHLFYQYNPDSVAWGNITWGHAISRDLITWFHLPLAMVIDHWYDANGVWSGSATVLPDGRVVMLYTGSAKGLLQVQNLAVPANLSDPLLIDWVKSDANPILFPPPGIGSQDFRDPTTAWYVPEESAWRIVIGSKDVNHNGLSFTYRTKDFVNYELIPTVMHVVPGTGMWECIDFYPVSTTEARGLETSANGPGIKHVLKASVQDDMQDYYAIGSYDVVANVWLPDDPESDVGIGLRLDYGKFYASKTFYDPIKERRVLWGWTGETDSELVDIRKGWASLQSIPRTVTFDSKTKANLLLWPVEEVENLRSNAKNLFENIKVAAGSVVPLNVGQGTQLDVVAEFEVKKEALKVTTEADVGYNCSTSGGSAGRGALGPFGFLVLADDKFSEQTAVYFYVARGVDGNLRTFICQDELRSSIANDITKTVYGTTIPVIDGEKLSLRILVDHSIVETFAQGGRRTITSRVYPTKAIYGEAKLFLFNNATGADVIATSVKVWQMKSALIRQYNFQNQTANGS